MNREEQLVEEYLKSKGYENVIFEPDGNIPPDFTINGSIAIEVRRLNQHIKNSSEIEPVEKLDFSIYSTIDKIINEIVVDNFDRSAFLLVHYNRPLSIVNFPLNRTV